MKRICALILVLLWAWSVTGANPVPGDSIGLKKIDGKTLIVYKVSAGETAYAVSRKYSISFKELEASNAGVNLGALKEGQEILVPTNYSTSNANSDVLVIEEIRKEEAPAPAIVEVKEKTEQPAENVVPEPVAKKEESQEIETVKTETQTSDPALLSEGDLETAPAVINNDKTKTFAQIYSSYMSTELIATSEKGVATWIENNGMQSSGDRFYALHNTAPIGSVIKVRNLMNNRTIYAKVIGNLSESEKQEKVLIKLSAGAAERLNVLDNRFVVEMTYYLAGENAMR